MNSTVTDSQLQSALDSMILSASGWRKVFAPGGDEAADTQPSPADRLLAVGMGVAWGEWLAEHLKKADTVVLAATDTRPTGPGLAEALMCGLESCGCRVRWAGIAAAPEAMARAGNDPDIDAFAYISASHNPVGHNGVKFGLGGGVIGGTEAASLIDSYRRLIGAPGAAERLTGIASAAEHTETPRLGGQNEKRRCLDAYKEFLETITGGPGNEESRRHTIEALKRSLKERPVGIVADLNGSARCLSVDRSYLEGLGVRLNTFNDEAGVIAHAILPEGDALEPCRIALEKAHADDENFLIGYVPDNDGDRGNLVVWDETIRGARILQAQDVFALSVLAEFASAAWGDAMVGGGGKERGAGGGSTLEAAEIKSALAVNGPTSHRVRRIAEAYGAEVFEAEVGEANVVNRAAELRELGYRVRLLGEGSNGGTITHPAAVRDPLNTITALLKLLRLPSMPGRPGPFEDWCRRIGRPELFRSDFGPADILAALPVYSTTPASAPRALMAITSTDQGALKAAWEDVFAQEWNKWAADLLRAYGFADWYELNNEGTASRKGVGPGMRSGRQSGGLKVVFTDNAGDDVGFLWMRGSGTEPVFRVMAEIRGEWPEAETALVEWHRGMVAEAERIAGDVPGEPGKRSAEAGRVDHANRAVEEKGIPSPMAKTHSRQ